MIPALSALSLGQKVAGVLISLVVWLAPAGGVWLYMAGKLDSQYQLGYREADGECYAINVGALKKALDDAAKAQNGINDQAAKDAEAIAASLADSKKQAARLTKELQAHATANPLPADCRADPARVQIYNEARTGRPSGP